MTERKALVVAFDNADKQFFVAHPDRDCHIRLPFHGECAGEFWSLGDHNRARRRILLSRCDATGSRLAEGKIMKIPFLLFFDEEVADDDAILLPILVEIMQNAFFDVGTQ